MNLAFSRGPQGFIKLVVLKRLRSELVADREARRMFLEEARICALLSHPNIVQVFEVIEHEGVPTMVIAEITRPKADDFDGPRVRSTYPRQFVAMPGRLRGNG